MSETDAIDLPFKPFSNEMAQMILVVFRDRITSVEISETADGESKITFYIDIKKAAA